MFLILKVTYHYHCSYQNVSFTFMEMSLAVDWRFSAKKLLDFIECAFLIVFPFLKNSYRFVSG